MVAAVAPEPPPAAGRWLIVAAGLHFRGGMDKANAELASYLLERGAALDIVAHDVDAMFRAHPRVTLHLVPRPLGSFALGEFGLDRRGRSVAKHLRASDPAARVIVNGGNCQVPDVNWVHYVHHAWTASPSDAPWWFHLKHRLFSARWRRMEKAAIRQARLVIANSEMTRTQLVAHVGASAERVRTIYLGTDAGWGPVSPRERASARAWLRLDGDRPAVAFVGALGRDRRKGFDTLWRAWTTLAAGQGWDVDLVVAGSGADGAALSAAAGQAGLADRVHVLGQTDRIKDVLAAVDLLVSPVRYEPYGLNVQEALCRGIPALVSRTAGVAERFPPELADLLLDDPDNSDDLVRRLSLWRANVDAWKIRVAPLGRELRSYGWRDMAAAFVGAVEGRTEGAGAVACCGTDRGGASARAGGPGGAKLPGGQ